VDYKTVDFDRINGLAQQGYMSTDSRDLAAAALRESRAVRERDGALEQAADRNVALAKANVRNALEALKLARITESYTSLAAPIDGVILVRQAELGEVVGPGTPIFTLADIDHVWLRAYVNETDVGRIRLGEPAVLTTDNYPGKRYRGRVSFIAEQAEFTPKSVETHAERVTLVYRIRIDVDNPTHELVPGMPADAELRLLR
jgi:HlyD family secretion protein